MEIGSLLYYNRMSPLVVSNQPQAATGAIGTVDAQAEASRVARTEAFSRASNLASALSDLSGVLANTLPRRARAAVAASSAYLNLDGGSRTPTTLRSNEEVNATATSFSPFGPAFSGSGQTTAEATISGVYNGLNQNDTLTFKARKTGTHGEDDLRFEVRNSAGDKIEDFWVRKEDPIGTEYTLSNGLVFTLGDGFVKKNDTFTLNVFEDVGSVVDPDKALNGVRNANPNLEYGLSVTDGSFNINGTTINVNASDSINDVLARITASAAGVTASFDNLLEQVVLTQDTPGSAFDIELADDTSGFLAATKLDTAASTPGSDGDESTPIGQLAQFASVSSNSITINNVSILVDVESDTLADILARIEASAANVSATLVNDRVFIRANDAQAVLELDDGDTGLFNALAVDQGRHEPVAGGDLSSSAVKKITSSILSAADALEALFQDDAASGALPADFRGLQRSVRDALKNAEADLLKGEVPRFGISFDLDALFEPPQAVINEKKLQQQVSLNFADFKAALLGDSKDPRSGFVHDLLELINQYTAGSGYEFATLGISLNVFA